MQLNKKKPSPPKAHSFYEPLINLIKLRTAERGEQKGSLSGGPGTQGGPGFRIVRFRM